MSDNLNNPKSLVTQILEETLDSIKKYEEFDQTIVDSLKHLAESGDLKKPQLVSQSLKNPSEQK